MLILDGNWVGIGLALGRCGVGLPLGWYWVGIWCILDWHWVAIGWDWCWVDIGLALIGIVFALGSCWMGIG